MTATEASIAPLLAAALSSSTPNTAPHQTDVRGQPGVRQGHNQHAASSLPALGSTVLGKGATVGHNGPSAAGNGFSPPGYPDRKVSKEKRHVYSIAKLIEVRSRANSRQNFAAEASPVAVADEAEVRRVLPGLQRPLLDVTVTNRLNDKLSKCLAHANSHGQSRRGQRSDTSLSSIGTSASNNAALDRQSNFRPVESRDRTEAVVSSSETRSTSSSADASWAKLRSIDPAIRGARLKQVGNGTSEVDTASKSGSPAHLGPNNAHMPTSMPRLVPVHESWLISHPLKGPEGDDLLDGAIEPVSRTVPRRSPNSSPPPSSMLTGGGLTKGSAPRQTPPQRSPVRVPLSSPKSQTSANSVSSSTSLASSPPPGFGPLASHPNHSGGLARPMASKLGQENESPPGILNGWRGASNRSGSEAPQTSRTSPEVTNEAGPPFGTAAGATQHAMPQSSGSSQTTGATSSAQASSTRSQVAKGPGHQPPFARRIKYAEEHPRPVKPIPRGARIPPAAKRKADPVKELIPRTNRLGTDGEQARKFINRAKVPDMAEGGSKAAASAKVPTKSKALPAIGTTGITDGKEPGDSEVARKSDKTTAKASDPGTETSSTTVADYDEARTEPSMYSRSTEIDRLFAVPPTTLLGAHTGPDGSPGNLELENEPSTSAEATALSEKLGAFPEHPPKALDARLLEERLVTQQKEMDVWSSSKPTAGVPDVETGKKSSGDQDSLAKWFSLLGQDSTAKEVSTDENEAPSIAITETERTRTGLSEPSECVEPTVKNTTTGPNAKQPSLAPSVLSFFTSVRAQASTGKPSAAIPPTEVAKSKAPAPSYPGNAIMASSLPGEGIAGPTRAVNPAHNGHQGSAEHGGAFPPGFGSGSVSSQPTPRAPEQGPHSADIGNSSAARVTPEHQTDQPSQAVEPTDSVKRFFDMFKQSQGGTPLQKPALPHPSAPVPIPAPGGYHAAPSAEVPRMPASVGPARTMLSPTSPSSFEATPVRPGAFPDAASTPDLNQAHANPMAQGLARHGAADGMFAPLSMQQMRMHHAPLHPALGSSHMAAPHMAQLPHAMGLSPGRAQAAAPIGAVGLGGAHFPPIPVGAPYEAALLAAAHQQQRQQQIHAAAQPLPNVMPGGQRQMPPHFAPGTAAQMHHAASQPGITAAATGVVAGSRVMAQPQPQWPPVEPSQD